MGNSFGEVALQRNSMRTATVKSESDCEFAFLTKEDYYRSIKKIAERLEEDRIDFLGQLPMFIGLGR